MRRLPLAVLAAPNVNGCSCSDSPESPPLVFFRLFACLSSSSGLNAGVNPLLFSSSTSPLVSSAVVLSYSPLFPSCGLGGWTLLWKTHVLIRNSHSPTCPLCFLLPSQVHGSGRDAGSTRRNKSTHSVGLVVVVGTAHTHNFFVLVRPAVPAVHLHSLFRG